MPRNVNTVYSTKKKENPQEIPEASMANLSRAGRPKGAKNKTTLFKEAMRDGFESKLEKYGQKVLQACVDKAIEGDTAAMKMILDRIVPVADLTDVKGSGTTQVVINVQGMEAKVDLMDGSTTPVQDTLDAEFEELD